MPVSSTNATGTKNKKNCMILFPRYGITNREMHDIVWDANF